MMTLQITFNISNLLRVKNSILLVQQSLEVKGIAEANAKHVPVNTEIPLTLTAPAEIMWCLEVCHGWFTYSKGDVTETVRSLDDYGK